MDPRLLRLDYLVLKNNKLTKVTPEILRIMCDEDNNNTSTLFKPILLTDDLLKLFDFQNNPDSPFSNDIHFTHNSGLKIVKTRRGYHLGYTLREKSKDRDIAYRIRLNDLNDFFDSLSLIKGLSYNIDDEFLKEIEKVLEVD